MATLRFDFHGIAGVQVHTEDRATAEFFAEEYSHHRVEALSEDMPRVTIRYHRGDTRPRAGYAHHAHKLVAIWNYRPDFSASEVSIEVHGNYLAISMVHHMLVHPSLRYLAAFREHILLHAAAVTYRGRSLIFSGKGGSGKTTTTALALAAGGPDWGIQADDYVFLGSDGLSRSYITRAHLYRDLIRWVPAVGEKLTASEHLHLRIFGALRERSHERIKWPLRLPLDRLWEGRDLAHQAAPAGLILLRRDDVRRPALAPETASPELIEDLLDMNDYEARHFRTLLSKSQAVSDPDRLLREWRERERGALASFLVHCPVYRLTLPTRAGAPEEEASALIGELEPLVARSVESG